MSAQNVAVTKALMESDNAFPTTDILDSINDVIPEEYNLGRCRPCNWQ